MEWQIRPMPHVYLQPIVLAWIFLKRKCSNQYRAVCRWPTSRHISDRLASRIRPGPPSYHPHTHLHSVFHLAMWTILFPPFYCFSTLLRTFCRLPINRCHTLQCYYQWIILHMRFHLTTKTFPSHAFCRLRNLLRTAHHPAMSPHPSHFIYRLASSLHTWPRLNGRTLRTHELYHLSKNYTAYLDCLWITHRKRHHQRGWGDPSRWLCCLATNPRKATHQAIFRCLDPVSH